MKRQTILITGQVQGVGCRPFVWRTATDLGLTGFVLNDTRGVVIQAQGTDLLLAEFQDRLRSPQDSAPLMKVESITAEDIEPVEPETGFEIRQSQTDQQATSQVTIDTAVCSQCLAEMNDPGDFRYHYPFINCTNCGPRYSIVKTIPYDRCNTTMQTFEMCEKCRQQYENAGDRRFHAQPVACADCGPAVTLTDSKGAPIETDSDMAIELAAQMLRDGKVLAIKGIGGFHLAADAKNENAVGLLRQRKRRDHKPFALMALDTATVEKYCTISQIEQMLLTSPQAPVVLLKRKPDTDICPAVAQGVDTLGFMLCYAPLHHLLFARDGIEVLVMTSANLSDEPLICDNDIAVKQLCEVVDGFLTHNRDVFRQVDDSVVQVIDGRQAMIRRSRGYAPNPVFSVKTLNKQVFAAGADLKNTFCFARDDRFILSEHIGDLDDAQTYRHYAESVRHLQKLVEVKPEMVVCDLHPGYLSSQFAEIYASENGIGKPLQVQHHWAHTASVLAEFGCEEKVIGMVADGTGYGTDGAIWGCECMIASVREYDRIGHLRYFDLPGGDAASKEAIRPILGLLRGLDEDYQAKYRRLIESVTTDTETAKTIVSQLNKRLNVVQTSSAGRLFDAVACMCGLGGVNHFQAQLPMALEAIAEKKDDSYPVEISKEEGTMLIEWRRMLSEMIGDLDGGTDVGFVSAKFHNWFAASMLRWAEFAREHHNINTVALSGGVFCNRYLSNRLIRMLKIDGFRVLFKKYVPANDGGISLGQAIIGASLQQ